MAFSMVSEGMSVAYAVSQSVRENLEKSGQKVGKTLLRIDYLKIKN